MVKNLLNIACGDFFPSKTFILDIDVSLSRDRRQKDKTRRGADRIEQEENDFFERVAAGYRTIAEENPENCILLSAASPPEDIFKLLVSHLHC
jgi:dTMP kinase